MRKNIRIRRWFVVLAITVFAAIYYRDTLGDILTEIGNLPASMTIIGFVFTYIYYLIEGKLIQYVASRHVKEFEWNQGVSIAYISSFYRFITMGAAAGPAEVYYLHRQGIQLSRATGMCLTKYIIHKITIVIFGIVSYLVLPADIRYVLKPYRTYILIGILIMAASVVVLTGVCTSRGFSSLIIRIIRKIPTKKEKTKTKIASLIANIILLQDESSELLRDKRKVLWIFILNVGKQTCYYLIPAIFLLHRSEIMGLYIVELMAVSNMLAGVLPAPSGIGSLEYVFLTLFQTLTEAEIAASVILIYRFVTWVIPFAIGGICVALQRKG